MYTLYYLKNSINVFSSYLLYSEGSRCFYRIRDVAKPFDDMGRTNIFQLIESLKYLSAIRNELEPEFTGTYEECFKHAQMLELLEK